MYYHRDFKIQGKNIRLTYLSRKGGKNGWEYYHSGREDFKPRIIPVGQPFNVISSGSISPEEIVEKDLGLYLKSALIGEELFARSENPIQLAISRGINQTLETSFDSPDPDSNKPLATHSLKMLVVPHHFFILEE